MSNPQKTLQAISDYFDLGLVLDSRRAKGTNQNYFVITSKGEFLFKILVNETADVSLETIELALPYLNRLEEYYFPFAAYYIKAPDGSSVYQGSKHPAVALHRLPGENPTLTEHVCGEVGKALALMHLVPTEGLPEKKSWLHKDYLPQSIEAAKQKFGADRLQKTLKEYDTLRHFQLESFPQSIIHGDLDDTNCLFDGDKLIAFLDWQDVSVNAAVLDFGSTVLGFCFVYEETPPYRASFSPQLYKSLYDAYTQNRSFSSYEEDYIEASVKYVGLTQPVWSMLHWEQYHPGEEMIEDKLLFWRFGLDTWKVAG